MDPKVRLVDPARILWAAALLAAPAAAQVRLDFRPFGNTQILRAAGDVSGGPVSRVWYSGADLHVRLHSGRVLRFSEAAGWEPAAVVQAPASAENGVRRYRADGDVFRSDDGGRSWVNLTSYRGESILGGAARDVAMAPDNPDEVVAVGETGVWRSLDGGRTWAGLNDRLPNLPVRRIRALPENGRGLQVETETAVLEWMPGQRLGWRPLPAPGNRGVVSAVSGDYIYLGFADGKVLVSAGGVAREPVAVSDAPIAALWADPAEPSTALAAAGARLYRTFNGGGFWDDITGTLDGGRLAGVAADRASRSIYVATERGVAFGRFDFRSIGASYGWLWLEGAALPKEPARDVRLDRGANQLFVALETAGVFAAMAPHRREIPAIAGAADGANRAASPGALLRLVGRGVSRAESGGRTLPVLATVEDETHLQVPFDAEGTALPLHFPAGEASFRLNVPLEAVSPGIFEDRDGSPLLLDADSGVLLDAMHPARPSMRVQILAAGLGRVRPDWPAGVPAPADDPPAVVAPVRAVLDGQTIPASRATLAPGYTGFYLVEFEMPAFVNAGSAELYLEAAGRASNRVRVYIEP
jgi:uncharacterized protein (TIGR03437 family)